MHLFLTVAGGGDPSVGPAGSGPACGDDDYRVFLEVLPRCRLRTISSVKIC
jgi:hypothetical protein